ncbi:SH3 domain-binding glutamic acid-rich protein [Grifola frondosa]|uniref:SH3 domain-binding glutamic acid-rich protein n=1 Tax=Grifola frondosa TaxID=5627 RepID=A0A1C7MNW4_GRIFR|nr:SH3 domain-binding glutamic acid-rich protein [Grifola frondosa]
MPSPPIQVFLTTIASQPALRQRQEYILRVLQVKKVPFTSYDLASDEDAKKLWKRKAPLDKQQLPGILVGGQFPGTFNDFEEAVECSDLDTFLRLNETWDPLHDDRLVLRAVPIGVPGAYSPLQMHPEHQPTPSPLPSPRRDKVKRENEVDAGEELGDSGLQGVNVTEDDLLALVEELGLGGDEATDLVKGLTGDSSVLAPKASADEKPEVKEPKAEAAVDSKAEDDKTA